MLHTKAHLKRAFELTATTPHGQALVAVQGNVEPVLEPSAVRGRLRDLGQRGGFLAFDYETNRLKPDYADGRIVCCSFSRMA
jgi:hypothetical protein